MKKIVGLMILTVLLALVPRPAGSQGSYRLGDRVVPGPLPPDPNRAAPALETRMDVVYGIAGEEELRLDFAKPVLCRDQPVPLAVYIHGGGWHQGDKAGAFNSSYARMFFQLGFAVASINYRLSPEYHFPAHIHDCKLAIRFLRKNAEDFGIHPDRIGVWGGSAGGHLVCLMGTADDDDGLEGPGFTDTSSRVAAVVNHFGPTDLTAFADIAPAQLTTLANFLGCNPQACPGVAAAASPVTYVTPDDPSLLTIHGDRDVVVPYSQAEILAEKLRLAGNACSLIKVKNAGHGFVPTPPGAEMTPDRDTISFLTVAHLARHIEPALLGDLDMDGAVRYSDVLALLSVFGTAGVGPAAAPAPDNWNPLADLYPDGIIDGKDAAVILQVLTSRR